MNPVAVIGGGITGLTAAFNLRRLGVPVMLFESGGRVGGVIESLRHEGYLAEFGPNTVLETSPKIGQLIRDAGLQRRRLNPDPRAEARYVVRDRQLVEMPGSPLGFFTTKLFSRQAKMAVLREPFVPARRDGQEESIADFVIRRLGQEFLDHAIDALVAGVYAGDPYKLSVQQAFPKLAQLEAKYGSLIKGQMFGGRERKKKGEVAKDRAPKFSFDEGLQVLPDTLAAQLGDAVKLNTAVTRAVRKASGWTLEFGKPYGKSSAGHSAVIYCGTAARLALLSVEVLNESEPPIYQPEDTLAPRSHGGGHQLDSQQFSEIRHPPVASVVLGFRREDVAHPCAGFGMLIPKVENFRILGTIFSSSLFPNRAPAGHLTLTSYLGGERCPELAAMPADDLVRITCEDLKVLLGVKGQPTFHHCAYYPKAIPQYNVGYGHYRALMSDLEARAPGFFLAGHYRDGVSLGDSIVSGCNVAERVAKALQA